MNKEQKDAIRGAFRALAVLTCDPRIGEVLGEADDQAMMQAVHARSSLAAAFGFADPDLPPRRDAVGATVGDSTAYDDHASEEPEPEAEPKPPIPWPLALRITHRMKHRQCFAGAGHGVHADVYKPYRGGRAIVEVLDLPSDSEAANALYDGDLFRAVRVGGSIRWRAPLQDVVDAGGVDLPTGAGYTLAEGFTLDARPCSGCLEPSPAGYDDLGRCSWCVASDALTSAKGGAR